jgi:hypothetical protein
MIKNEDIQWETFTPVGFRPQTLAQVHEAFKYRRAEKRLLPSGMKICRLQGDKNGPQYDPLAAWWSPYDEYDYDAGIVQRQKFASANGVSIREMSRLVMAVREDWNALNFLWVATLKVSIYAFFGIVAGQVRQTAQTDPTKGPFVSQRNKEIEKSSGTRNLVGNNSQFYIHAMSPSDISNSQFIPLT